MPGAFVSIVAVKLMSVGAECHAECHSMPGLCSGPDVATSAAGRTRDWVTRAGDKVHVSSIPLRGAGIGRVLLASAD